MSFAAVHCVVMEETRLSSNNILYSMYNSVFVLAVTLGFTLAGQNIKRLDCNIIGYVTYISIVLIAKVNFLRANRKVSLPKSIRTVYSTYTGILNTHLQ